MQQYSRSQRLQGVFTEAQTLERFKQNQALLKTSLKIHSHNITVNKCQSISRVVQVVYEHSFKTLSGA